MQHIPVLWKDAPVKPFRFNRKSDIQADKYFVEVMAEFNLIKGCFEVTKTINTPSIKIPYFKKYKSAKC